MLTKRLPRCSLRQPQPCHSTRNLTTSRQLRAEDPLHSHPGSSGGHHGDHYDPPGGWLWGLRPGEKYEKEGWENLFYYGFYGSFAVAAVAYAFKPDTSIQTWALEEARRRLEKEGILEDPSPEK